MKRLSELLRALPKVQVWQTGTEDVSITQITADSRAVRPGALFVAWRGKQTDGHQYIPQALAKGAVALLLEKSSEAPADIPVLLVESAREAYAYLSAAWFDFPAEKLNIVGITGTNGKSSTTYYLYQLLRGLGKKVGLIGTVFCLAETETLPATLTTPDSYELHRLFRHFVEKGITHAVMEVSSIALDQYRTAGLNFAGAIFTNLSHDHLDYHGTFTAYRDAKKKLFDGLSPQAFALTNADDKHGTFMLQNTAAERYAYTLEGRADFSLRLREAGLWGIEYDLALRYGEVQTKKQGIPLIIEELGPLSASLLGRFQAYNLIAALGAAFLLERGTEAASLRDLWRELGRLSTLLHTLPGRLEPISLPEGRLGLVDYAHTPDAVEKVLKALRPLIPAEGKLFAVLGAGGDRDRAKRGPMAQIAALHADTVILTSDNPRSEDPLAIIREMLEGVPSSLRSRVVTIPDRAEAIRVAVQLSPPKSLVAVLGKGHETYQEIQGVRYPFSDREILQSFSYAQ
ncbi:MAG: UDP-N-acetylmuramoyl-L-alanyl-D-glutamate--2,6-diaminopimelate ligase [Bacteroidia bacterium]|nr:UDP-N-acetylmuramoyl-L-alanyl-D-glutamate--2,6-diaminopimelate ligase [Bacteroidia bacterium]MCX7652205.1 UDP-N-acetylmuramoyl-L-alanyl-D-glutamate--2,6-diaminopimelate ligase [Bacteroidia bacterium]MDW8416467.1 UDP-N-acetylmuramoyl-L-alanyl-D-glutamate--2,6-diaminopimelate ligase [Bacteroidia bacterium]